MHRIGVAEAEAVSSVGCVIVIDVVAGQPFASEIVYVYEPAVSVTSIVLVKVVEPSV